MSKYLAGILLASFLFVGVAQAETENASTTNPVAAAERQIKVLQKELESKIKALREEYSLKIRSIRNEAKTKLEESKREASLERAKKKEELDRIQNARKKALQDKLKETRTASSTRNR